MKKSYYRNVAIILGFDVLLLAFSWYFAHLLRFNFIIPESSLDSFKSILPFVIVIKLIVFYFCDLYRGMWRYTSIVDLLNIIKATTAGALIIVLFILFRYRFIGYSRSIFLIDWFLTVIFIAGFRLSVRLFFERFSGQQPTPTEFLTLFRIASKKGKESKNLLIIGAGDCGEKIYREIRDNASLQYQVVGFLDDSRQKIGRTIHGIPVLSSIDDIDAAVKWGDNKIFFFKGAQYLRYDMKTNRVDDGYPKPIARNWIGLWDSDIDAAVNWGKTVYFFKGNEYIRYSKKRNAIEPGYPKLIDTGWPKLWGTSRQPWERPYTPSYTPSGDVQWQTYE